jgi:chemotaxis protein methyltransferase CheR
MCRHGTGGAGGVTLAIEREYPLSNAEFEQIRELVRQHTGIALAESKRELVYSRLTRRLRQLRQRSFRDYIVLLEDADSPELEEFTNAITTNLTSFFRETHHFDHLTNSALPEIEKRNAATRRLRIWSAGCSTGEEPYSLAITLQESMQRFKGWDVRILATDLDSRVLAYASTGDYPTERFERMPTAQRRRWFIDRPSGLCTAKPELKSMIAFRRLNLMHSWPFQGPFDIIFCRNVVIYFDKETQRQLFGRMAQIQRVGDHLCIGHSESLFKVCELYERVGKTIYKRTP